jgi:hypothetical protein
MELFALRMLFSKHAQGNQITLIQVSSDDGISMVGSQMDGMASSHEDPSNHATSQCLVAIGRLQVTSSPNNTDLFGANNANATEFISRHSIDGKFTFVDQRFILFVIITCSVIEIFKNS